MPVTIALTGMTGFIGRHIAENLLARGYAVRALTRSKADKTSVNNLTWITGDLDNPDALSELVYGAESVVHCAGQVRGHKEAIFTHCNVTGSLQLLQAAKKVATLSVSYLCLLWLRATLVCHGMPIPNMLQNSS